MTVRVVVPDHLPIEPGACRVIAEAGVNHHNSVDGAIELVRAAASAGAWAIKFQLYKADRIAARDAPKYWQDASGEATQHAAFARSDRIDYERYAEVAAACAEAGIVFFATPFDELAVDALERIGAPLYKIASGDITHRPLLERVAATGKPVLLSTGASTGEEIDEALGWLGLGPDRLVLLACTLTYPTPDDDADFARLEQFRQRFHPYLCGFSDHTLGVDGAAITAALGGVCIEKHFTLDRTAVDVPDHRMSVDPYELRRMVALADRAARLRGETAIGVRDSERPARRNARRSIVLARDLAAGARVQAADLAYLRPGDGISPARREEVIGRVVRRGLAAGTRLDERDLD